MIELKVRGAEQLGDLAKRLRQQGESGKGMRLELLREIRGEAKTAARATQEAIINLPTEEPEDRGLRRQIARQVKVRIRLTGARTGVRIVVGRLDGTNLPRRFNRGRWRHPVHGTDTWVTQTVEPGWFDKTLKDREPQLRAAVLKAMKRTSRQVTKG